MRLAIYRAARILWVSLLFTVQSGGAPGEPLLAHPLNGELPAGAVLAPPGAEARFVAGPVGRALALSPGQAVRVPAPPDAAFPTGFALSFWIRTAPPEGTRGVPMLRWGDALRMSLHAIEAARGLEARVTLGVGEERFEVRSRYALPVNDWARVSISYSPEADTEGHLSVTGYRPEFRQTGLLTITIGGVPDEPFGRSWSGIEAFGLFQPPAGPIEVGGPAFDGAVAGVELSAHPRGVHEEAMRWLASPQAPARPPEAGVLHRGGEPDGFAGFPAALQLVPTFHAIGVYALHATPPRTDQVRSIRYRAEGESDWRAAPDPVLDRVAGESRGSILNVASDTVYEIEFSVGDAADRRILRGRVRTWSEAFPVGEVRELPEDSGEALVITDRGRPDAWIVYRPRAGAVARIDAGNDAAHAVFLDGAAYVAIENVIVRGGRRDAVHVRRSEHIRIRHCDIAGWGDPGVRDDTLPQGLYVDASGRPINKQAGVRIGRDSRGVVVEGNFIHSPRGTANSWAYGHPMGPQGIINGWTGGNNVIRFNDIIGSERHWWNDAIEGEGNGSVFGGPYRDTDIQGNHIVFANDDGTELDGGQINVRFWDNRVEHVLCGISGAPCLRGPAYVFRNLFVHLGDERGISGACFKMGTGSFPVFGLTFIWHNTTMQPPARVLNATNTSGGLIRASGGRERWSRISASAPIISRNNLYGFGGFGYPARPGILHSGDFERDLMAEGAVNPEVARVADRVTPPADYLDPDAGDFRISEDSPARGAGVPIPGVSDRTTGAGPDLGAIEGGPQAPRHFPARPWSMEVTPQRVSVGDLAEGREEAEAQVSLVIPPAAGTRWRAVSNAPWLTCEPAEGPASETPIAVTLRIRPDGVRLHRGAVTFRTDTGRNVTVLVSARVIPDAFFLQSIEAEEARIEGEMEIADDPRASGGRYVYAAGEPEAGRIDFEFVVPEDGTYYLLGRVSAPGPVPEIHDSFFVSVNGESPRRWDLRPARADVWEWRRIPVPRGTRGEGFALQAGKHRLALISRETLSRIDRIVVTDFPYEDLP